MAQIKVAQLTPQQSARFPEFVKRWTDYGLSTAPANRAEAERGVIMAYHAAGLEPPKRIVWCGSPLSQGLTRAIVCGLKNPEVNTGASVWDSVRDSVWASVGDSVRDSVRDSVWASVGDSVRDSVGASVWASVRDSVGDSVGASVGASVGDSVRASVWASVGDSVRASVRDSVWASVWASVGASVRDSVWASGYGQHDAGWLSFYDFFRDACGMDEETQQLAGLWLLCKSAGWFLPHRNICWICERHNILNRNDQGQLHCETGPALSYPDGWSIYAIDGIRLDEQIIMRPDTQTLQQLNGEQNGDIRTIRINRFGWTRYLKESGARQLDVRDNEIEGTIESLYVTDRGERRLVATCPSGKIAVMGVPSSVATCEQAANYLIPFTRIPGLPKARILART